MEKQTNNKKNTDCELDLVVDGTAGMWLAYGSV